jgi:predicted MPP superfamily phosphohydrolase
MGRFFVFIAVVLAVVAGIHYYLWARLVRDPQLPAPWNGVLTAAMALLAVGTPAAIVVGRVLGRNRPGMQAALAWPAFIWLGTMFLLLTAVFAADAARAIVAIARRVAGSDAIDPDRRTFLARLSATAIAVLVTGLGGVAVRAALRPVDVRRVRVRLERLPRRQHGFSLVQLTDLHVGPTIGREFMDDVVRRTNALEPDLIAITGDLVDGSVEQLRDAVAPLANLRARHGVFFVTGNHEYFSGAEAWLNELGRLGIRVLRNERVSIGEGDASFDLGGIDDHSANRYGGLEPAAAIAQALSGRDTKRELVLLAHQPRSLLVAEPFGVGLQLSGHTHGGQLWPFRYLVRLQQPFVAGLYRRGAAQIYVSRGTGYWGPPMRLGAPAEITHVTLESAAAV